MIGTALFLLCATANAHADVDGSDLDGFFNNGCPKDTSIQKVLPHEDCQQYYQCIHGVKVARYCPTGLRFNAGLGECDWIRNAECHMKPRQPSSQELNKSDFRQVNLICSLPDSDGVSVAHMECNKFYKCLDTGKVVLYCAKGLLYNTATQTCDLPRNVKCGRRLRDVDEEKTTEQNILTTANTIYGYSYSIEDIDQSNADPSQAIAQCSSKSSDGVIVAHENCNMFYKCSGGVPVTMKCPNSLLYNPVKELCDWPGNMDCGDRLPPEFDDNRNRNAPIVDNNNEDYNDYERAAAEICAAENSDGILTAHEKCNHFYKCSNDKPVAYSCPGDLLFNSIKFYCDWPNKVNCGERIEDAISNDEHQAENPKNAYEICSAEDSDDVLVAHESCNKFFKCHDGLPVVIQCPSILLYNIKEEICDWPTHVYCKDRIVPDNVRTLIEEDEKSDDSKTKTIHKKKSNKKNQYPKKNYKSRYDYHIDFNKTAETCADESFDGKTLPHENCNQFYKCSERTALPFFCPLNLVYNIQKVFCDWPSNVICGNRLLPKKNNDDEKTKDSYSECRDKADGFIISHEHCSRFYKCDNGYKYPMDCPEGLYFNTLRVVCDWPMNVDCGDRLTEAQLTSEPI